MKQSYFNAGRKLLPDEWEELKVWRKENPELRWRAGDTHPETGLVFIYYARNTKNGECWGPADRLAARRQQIADGLKNMRLRDPEGVRAYGRSRQPHRNAHHKKNPHRRNAYVREYDKKRRETDAVYALTKRVRTRTRSAFRKLGFKKGSKTEQMLGCSWPELRAHIESHFTEGMSWERMSLIDIDHHIPLASATCEASLLALCHYSNLRPLWSSDNRRKRDSMPG